MPGNPLPGVNIDIVSFKGNHLICNEFKHVLVKALKRIDIDFSQFKQIVVIVSAAFFPILIGLSYLCVPKRGIYDFVLHKFFEMFYHERIPVKSSVDIEKCTCCGHKAPPQSMPFSMFAKLLTILAVMPQMTFPPYS